MVPAGCASALLGATLGLVIAGLATRFQESFGLVRDSNLAPAGLGEAVTGAVVGVALMTLAIGVRLPQRLAVWVCVMAWQRLLSRGRQLDMSGVLLGPVGPDRPLYWVVLSVIALTAGIMTALTPLSVRLALAAYHWMHAHFIWSAGPLAVLQASTLFLAGLVPLTILGLAVSCTHHLSCPHGRWETRATAWLLIGASTGVLISTWITQAGGQSDLTLIVAALPVLVVSLFSAVVSSRRGVARPPVVAPTAPLAGRAKPDLLPDAAHAAQLIPLPTWSDRWPTLLRASVVAVGGGGACAVSAWVVYFGPLVRNSNLAPAECDVFTAAMLLAMGVGVLAGCRRKRSGLRSIGGFGVACAVAGVIVAASTIGMIETSKRPNVETSKRQNVETPKHQNVGISTFRRFDFSMFSLACASLIAIGLATAYGGQTLLSRVAFTSSAGATILARMLVCAALTVWIGVPIAQRLVGGPATLMILALSLLTLGGTLIIHEPSQSPRTRRARLCALFASIGVMIVVSLFPPR